MNSVENLTWTDTMAGRIIWTDVWLCFQLRDAFDSRVTLDVHLLHVIRVFLGLRSLANNYKVVVV